MRRKAGHVEWRQNSGFHRNVKHLAKDLLLLFDLLSLWQIAVATDKTAEKSLPPGFPGRGQEPVSLNV